MKPRFRLATISDCELLLDFMSEYYAFDGHSYDREKARSALIGLLKNPVFGLAWLVMDGDTPAGYVVLCFGYSHWLGSSRLASTPSRALYYDAAYAPYGESYAGSGTTDLSFTGQNQDTVSGMHDFLYREYHSVQGRWISPDPTVVDVSSSAPSRGWDLRYGGFLFLGENAPSKR